MDGVETNSRLEPAPVELEGRHPAPAAGAGRLERAFWLLLGIAAIAYLALPYAAPGLLPLLLTDRTVAALPEVRRGETPTASFRVTNPWLRPLEVASISQECGCTNLRGLPAQLMPWTTYTIRTGIDTTSLSSPYSKKIFIAMKTPGRRGYVFTLKGSIKE